MHRVFSEDEQETISQNIRKLTKDFGVGVEACYDCGTREILIARDVKNDKVAVHIGGRHIELSWKELNSLYQLIEVFAYRLIEKERPEASKRARDLVEGIFTALEESLEESLDEMLGEQIKNHPKRGIS